MDNCWEKIGTRNHPTNYGVHRRFGTDESVPYAHAGKYTIQRTAQKSLPIGMHKCIPYENSVNASYAALSRYRISCPDKDQQIKTILS